MTAEIRWVITANFTEDGAVAWRRSDGTWARSIAEASHHTEADAKPLVESAKLELHLVCDPYPAAVRVEEGVIRPASTRERVRACGPTIPLPTGLLPSSPVPSGPRR